MWFKFLVETFVSENYQKFGVYLGNFLILGI